MAIGMRVNRVFTLTPTRALEGVWLLAPGGGEVG